MRHSPGNQPTRHPPGTRRPRRRRQLDWELIAVRVLHFLILSLLGIGVLAFAADHASLKNTFYRVLTDLQGGVAGGPVQTSGHVGILHDLDRLFSLRTGTLRETREVGA